MTNCTSHIKTPVYLHPLVVHTHVGSMVVRAFAICGVPMEADKWKEYELEKAIISEKAQTSEEYEAMIRALAERMGL